MTSPGPTDPVRVDAPTLQDRLKRDASVIYLRSRWLGSRVPTSVENMREAAERLDTLEAQLAERVEELAEWKAHGTSGWKLAATRAAEWKQAEKERDALRGQVTKAVNIVRDQLEAARAGHRWAQETGQHADMRQWAHTMWAHRAVLEAFAAAGLPVGGETETTDGE